jgi:hypothetical protein
LQLTGCQTYSSGLVQLSYDVVTWGRAQLLSGWQK